MKRLITTMALAFVTALTLSAPIASAEDPDGSPPVSDIDGGDTGGAAVNCNPVAVKWTDTFHELWGRTYRVAGRLAYQKCYPTVGSTGAKYIRVTHVGGWYAKTNGPQACIPVAGSPSINGFQVNINGFDGYDPAPLWMDCDGNEGWAWVDIPNRRVDAGEDRCFDVSWAKAWAGDGNQYAFSNFADACLPWP